MRRTKQSARFRRALPAILAPGATVVLCATVAAPFAAAQPGVDLEDCRLDGVSVPARCGSLTVYEDRSAGDGRTIDLKIVVIPAVSDNPEPDPLFFLAGGPGQAATEVAGPMLPLLADVRRNRDLVFVDQRGTGGSGRMTCAFFESEVDEQQLGESLQVDTLPLDDLRECLAEVEAVADPRQYTTPVAMDDLDDVRAALGYETINLYGGSYGTRAGLVYMRRQPDRVRTAVLDGLAPVSMRLPSNVNVDAHRALDRLFADCAADAGCNEAFPDLAQTFARVIANIEANPQRLDATHPRTGEPFGLTLTAAGFAGGLRGVLYSPTLASLVPWTIALEVAHLDHGSVPAAESRNGGRRIRLGGRQLLLMSVAVASLVLLASALQMFVATFARSFKEAQTYVSLLIFVPIIPSTVLQFYPLQSAGWMMLVPALSHHLLLVDVMGGEPIAALSLVTSAVATTVQAVLFLALTSWLLQKEKIVFGRT